MEGFSVDRLFVNMLTEAVGLKERELVNKAVMMYNSYEYTERQLVDIISQIAAIRGLLESAEGRLNMERMNGYNS